MIWGHISLDIPSHALELHNLNSMLFDPSAEQYMPPFSGAGLLQARVLDVCPPPQAFEHVAQVIQAPPPPLTALPDTYSFINGQYKLVFMYYFVTD